MSIFIFAYLCSAALQGRSNGYSALIRVPAPSDQDFDTLTARPSSYHRGQQTHPQQQQQSSTSDDHYDTIWYSHHFPPSHDGHDDNGKRVSSPSPFDNCPKMSSSRVISLENGRNDKKNESPMIVFNERGVMHTNFYPPQRLSEDNSRKIGGGVAEAVSEVCPRYQPKWSAVTEN